MATQIPMIKTHEQILPSGQRIGWITLAQPASLNALTLDMALAMRKQLEHWVIDPAIVCVAIDGEGRAFCAGGDVRRMREGILAGDDYCERFFEQEYRLDYAIHTYPKPLLVWGHGVVMGGGLGLLVGAAHRIATTSTRFAMPETSIGLYPDVGASYFLNRLPEGLGLFLGVTGCEWNAVDAVTLGLADHAIDDSEKEPLPALLASLSWCGERDTDNNTLRAALGKLRPTSLAPQLTPHIDAVAPACKNHPPAQMPAALRTLDIHADWYRRALQNLDKGSPVTTCLVAAQLQRGRNISLADAFRMEWILSVQCCRHPDFPEGVRAQLVDKDKSPRWTFSHIEAVPAAYIDAHFRLPEGLRQPLADLGLPEISK